MLRTSPGLLRSRARDIIFQTARVGGISLFLPLLPLLRFRELRNLLRLLVGRDGVFPRHLHGGNRSPAPLLLLCLHLVVVHRSRVHAAPAATGTRSAERLLQFPRQPGGGIALGAEEEFSAAAGGVAAVRTGIGRGVGGQEGFAAGYGGADKLLDGVGAEAAAAVARPLGSSQATSGISPDGACP